MADIKDKVTLEGIKTDNLISKINVKGTTFEVQDKASREAIDTLNSGKTTEGSVAKAIEDLRQLLIGLTSDEASADTIEGAKRYADNIFSTIVGEDSWNAEDLATLKEVVQELKDNVAEGGIADTVLDTFSKKLGGLTVTATYKEGDTIPDGQNVGDTYQKDASVKEYVDAQVTDANTKANDAIDALDADVSSANGSYVNVNVKQENGKITDVKVTETDFNTFAKIADFKAENQTLYMFNS